MSRIPSNTEQFLGGVAAGVQNVGQAAQNFQISSQRDLALQELAQRDRQMEQQGQQFERGLKAEEENYRRLNESRERMQAQELGQQGAQFNQRMEFDREQARLEQLMSIKLKNLEFEMAANEREIAAAADNDPRLVELKAKRRALRADSRNIEQMIGAAGMASQFAGEVRGDRMSEVESLLTAQGEALATRNQAAMDAVRQGFDYASLTNAGKENFISQVTRLQEAMTAQFGVLGTAAASITGASPVGIVVLDNIAKWALGASGGNKDVAQITATNFAKNGGAMAAAIVENTFDLGGASFGLTGPNQEKAKRLMGEIVSSAAIIRNVTPEMRASGVDVQGQREKIAANLQELRNAGLGDEQIGGILDGLESIASNRVEVLRMMDPTELGGPNQELLQQSFAGVDRIHDVIDGVANDKTLMGKYGGVVTDHSKYDYIGTMRRARLAYGAGESEEFAALMQELDMMGMNPKQMEQIRGLLINAEKGLDALNPQVYRDRMAQLGQRQVAMGTEAEALDEILAERQAQIMAGSQAGMYRSGQRALSELEDLARGG